MKIIKLPINAMPPIKVYRYRLRQFQLQVTA